ncbi:MAG: hypothetical protein KDA58_11080 [Planctomycetaceae bacterium]|nr:hypothetical protein [Planctomycetaceae bacterium]
MYFRFATAIALVTAISLVGIALEKQNLALKRTISLQHYQLQILREQEARLRLEVHQLKAPHMLQAAQPEPRRAPRVRR